MSFVKFLNNMRKHLGISKSESATDLDLKSMTVVSLRAMAKERGISGYSKLNKAGLIELLS